MKKLSSYILTLSFSLLLLGIIGIQAYWLKTAVDIRNKQFEASVFNALDNLIKKVEEKENANAIVNWAGKDTTIVSQNISEEGKTVNVFSHNMSDTIIHTTTDINSQKASVTIKVDSENSKVNTKKIFFTKETTVIDTAGDIITQNMTEITSPGSVKAKLNNISLLVYKMIGNSDSLKFIEPNGKEIENMLKEELKQQNINLPANLLIKNSDTVSYANTNDSASVLNSHLNIKLYPNDLFGRQTLVYVNFPGRLSYITADMKGAISLAVVFTLLMIIVFIYTLINLNKQKKLNEIKTDFINNMSHELKTPIASIQLASDLLFNNTDKLDKKQIKEMSKTIHEQSVKINDDIKNILQHSLLDINNKETFDQTIHIPSLIDDVIATVQLLADNKHISIQKNTDENISILGNEELLLRAVVNLLDNAIKYSPEHSSVQISTINENQKLQIMVTDHGIGISPEELPYIFDKFYRVEKGDIHNTKGYGLGLSLVKKVAAMHHGKVWAESESEQGSRFILELPL